MARRLLLQRYNLDNVNYQWVGAYRLRVEASDADATGADPNVFLYQRRPPNPYDGSVLDDFIAVASPADMTEYPVGEPADHTTYPIFRLAYVELDLRGVDLAEDTWVLLVSEVGTLLTALDRLELLVLADSVTVGTPAAGGSSSSSSQSTSGSSSGSIP